MTQEVTLYRTENVDGMMRLGSLLAQSGYFTDSREAAQAVTKMMAGAELGFGPIASMTGINIIKGKVTLSANLIAAAIKRSGRYNYRVRQMTDTVCEIAFYEGKDEIGVSRFSMDDAKAAGLNTGDNWRKFPRNMLFARAISNGAKWYCPDLSGGPLYTPDELGAQVDGETGEVIDAPAPRIVVETPTPQPANGKAPAQVTNGGDGLPFANTKRAAVDWAMQYAPHVWPVGNDNYIVRSVVEKSFDNCMTANSDKRGEDLGRAWIAKVNDKIKDSRKPPIIAADTADDPDGWQDIEAAGVEAPKF